MSRRFWIADCHLGHANVAKYARRPWLNPAKHLRPDGNWVSEAARIEVANKMNSGLIREINSRVRDGDTVVHVGDFCCKGAERGEAGVRIKAEEWETQLNGKWLFILGNHDINNGVRFAINSAVVKIGPYKAFVRHIPIDRIAAVPGYGCTDADGKSLLCDFVICGHVHTAWKEKLIDGIWNINVGVDVRKFAPVTDAELVSLYEQLKRKPIENDTYISNTNEEAIDNEEDE